MSDNFMHIAKNMYQLMPLFQSKVRIKKIRKELEEKGFKEHFNKNHIRALFLLSNKGNMISSQLGKLIGLERGSVTTLVKHLMQEGYVAKEQCEVDKRKQFLVITYKGKSMVEEIDKLYIKEVKSAFEKLSEDELDKFIKSLDSLTKIIKKL